MEYIIKNQTVTTCRAVWEPDEPATSQLIDPLLADICGQEVDGAFLATRERAKEILTWGQMKMADLEVILTSYHDGYTSALMI